MSKTLHRSSTTRTPRHAHSARLSRTATALAVASVCAVGVGAQGQAQAQARPAGATAAGEAMGTSYGATLLLPRAGTKVLGAVGMIAHGMGMTTGMSSGSSSSSGTMVALSVQGLVPNANYAARVYAGPCGTNTKLRYLLPLLHANMMGEAQAVATIGATSVPAMGLHVNIHRANKALTVVSCGAVHRPTEMIMLAPTASAVSAVAMVTKPVTVMASHPVQGTEVVVFATGLMPNMAHGLHIHAGVCGTSSPVMYPLTDLVADPRGRALQGTAIPDVVPSMGMSIHIHAPTWNMMACGNLAR